MNKFNIAKIKQQLKARKFIIGQSFCALLGKPSASRRRAQKDKYMDDIG